MSEFSVIIPTYQGKEKVIQTLRFLELQTCKDFCVTVVIDGSTDGTAEALSTATFALTLSVISQKNRGRAGARNAGAALSTTDYLLFLDDDLIIPETLVEKYRQYAIEQLPIVVGSALPVMDEKNEFHRYANYLNNKWSKESLSEHHPAKLDFPYLNAQNFIIKREVFESLNGFDERLTDAEDFDLAVRAFDACIPIHFYKELQVSHKLQNNFIQYFKRLSEYRSAYTVLERLNDSAVRYLKKQEKPVSPVKGLIYRFFSGSFWLHAIDRHFFKALPETTRFKLYDVILTANLKYR